MPLVALRDVDFRWSGPTLLDGVNLEINRGEHIGLVGRNGAGKSTLMKILAGEVDPDHGQVIHEPQTRIARLIQEVPDGSHASVTQIVAEGYLTATTREESSEHSWDCEQAVNRVLSKMELDGNQSFAELSSGMKRRVLLAQALVAEPDLLLLDEPTNHLDIASIEWLEGFLKGYRGAFLFVTHDRVFLQALSQRILEVDRGHLFDWTCDYATFQKRKQASLDAEEKQNQLFDKKLAQEEAWIRQGIKARRTRNQGRVRRLKRMREDHRTRRQQLGNVTMRAAAAEKSGQLVLEATDVCFSYDDRKIIDRLTTLISRGDKIGLIGPNGAGKTTLLRVLLGELTPQAGTIRFGTKLQIVYFDQLREQIDPDKSVAENVGEGQDVIEIHGKRTHIYGYLQDFLFTPERAREPAKFLSGGERNRLLLARLFKKPSNVLVLDEPTNDLDTETLELLEELVSDYEGTLLLVSHDRAFLNNVVTSTLALDGSGNVKEYAGGYDDYLTQTRLDQQPATATKVQEKAKAERPKKTPDNKLSYHERRELESLPAEIEKLELEQGELHTAMADADFFKQDGGVITEATQRLSQIEAELTEKYQRWEELDAREN